MIQLFVRAVDHGVVMIGEFGVRIDVKSARMGVNHQFIIGGNPVDRAFYAQQGGNFKCLGQNRHMAGQPAGFADDADDVVERQFQQVRRHQFVRHQNHFADLAFPAAAAPFFPAQRPGRFDQAQHDVFEVDQPFAERIVFQLDEFFLETPVHQRRAEFHRMRVFADVPADAVHDHLVVQKQQMGVENRGVRLRQQRQGALFKFQGVLAGHFNGRVQQLQFALDALHRAMLGFGIDLAGLVFHGGSVNHAGTDRNSSQFGTVAPFAFGGTGTPGLQIPQDAGTDDQVRQLRGKAAGKADFLTGKYFLLTPYQQHHADFLAGSDQRYSQLALEIRLAIGRDIFEPGVFLGIAEVDDRTQFVTAPDNPLAGPERQSAEFFPADSARSHQHQRVALRVEFKNHADIGFEKILNHLHHSPIYRGRIGHAADRFRDFP